MTAAPRKRAKPPEPPAPPGPPAPPAKTKRPRTRLLALVALLVVVVGVAVLVSKPWRPLRYGHLDPPRPDPAGLEPSLARRLESLTTAVERKPYDAEAWGVLGVTLDVHDLQRDAITCYERAHRLDPTAFPWVYFLGLATFDSDHRTALRHLETAAGLRPGYAPLELHLGRAYIDDERLDEAEARFRRAAALDGRLVRPHVGLAQIALARGETDAALTHLETALALGPRSGEVHLLLAETHRRLGDDAAAAEHRARAGDRRHFEEFPDEIRARWQWEAGVTLFWRRTRADRYLEMGQVDRALAEWTALLADDPGSARAHTEIGRIHEGNGALPAALAAYQRALALDASSHGVRHRVGVVLCQLGRWDEGLAALHRASRGRPDDVRLAGDLARALRQAGRTRAAADAWRRYARLLAAAGRAAEAADAQQEAARLADGAG